jgi:hypothetical protein
VGSGIGVRFEGHVFDLRVPDLGKGRPVPPGRSAVDGGLSVTPSSRRNFEDRTVVSGVVDAATTSEWIDRRERHPGRVEAVGRGRGWVAAARQRVHDGSAQQTRFGLFVRIKDGTPELLALCFVLTGGGSLCGQPA